MPKTPFSAFLISLIFCLPEKAEKFYVSTDGKDSNNGHSLATAFKTIQKALNVATAGDTILVSTGKYKQNLTWKNSGTAAKPVVLRQYGNGKVYVQSKDEKADAVLAISNIKNIVVDGLYISRDNAMNGCIGILIESSGNAISKNIEIKNCVFEKINWSNNPNIKPTTKQNSQPLIAYGRSSQPMQNINVHDCKFKNNITGQSETLSINSNIDGFSITNNILHDNSNIAIVAIGFERENADVFVDQARNGTIASNRLWNNQSPYAEAGSIYVDGGKNILIEQNLIYNGDFGIEISAKNDPSEINYETENITVRNNIIYDCRSVGIKIGAYRGMLRKGFIVNNTSFYNNRGGYRDGDSLHESRKIVPWSELVLDNMEDVTIEDNIFYSRGGNKNSSMLSTDGASRLTNVTLNYNLYYNKSSEDGSGLQFSYSGNHYNSWSAYQNNNVSGFDKKSLYADPYFVNEGVDSDRVIHPNLHIRPNSPAIDRGDKNAVTGIGPEEFGTKDFFGNKRKVRIIDIGAHEFSGEELIALSVKKLFNSTGMQGWFCVMRTCALHL